jgi:hypothetical protein
MVSASRLFSGRLHLLHVYHLVHEHRDELALNVLDALTLDRHQRPLFGARADAAVRAYQEVGRGEGRIRDQTLDLGVRRSVARNLTGQRLQLAADRRVRFRVFSDRTHETLGSEVVSEDERPKPRRSLVEVLRLEDRDRVATACQQLERAHEVVDVLVHELGLVRVGGQVVGQLHLSLRRHRGNEGERGRCDQVHGNASHPRDPRVDGASGTEDWIRPAAKTHNRPLPCAALRAAAP